MSSNIVCSVKTCKKAIAAGDLTIGCWLCDNVMHAKCIGVAARTVDDVRKNIGLRYCCEACRDVEREMTSFMRQTKSGFKGILTSFRKTLDMFLALDTQFNSLTLLNESPRRKKTAIGGQHVDGPQLPATGSQQQPPTAQPSTSALIPRVLRSSARKDSVSECAAGVSVPPSTDYTIQLSLVPPQGVPRLLLALLVFVSRLNPDTTVKDVAIHLSNKLNVPLTEFSVLKFNFKQKRDISSFKISLSDALYSKVLDASVWPVHAIVHEFHYKSNPRAGVPLTPSTRPPKK
ncbi:hypothetical protein KR200_009134 [Drosophila serrata]|nr:hypothetical protein KR200_009134 [Drosophila serrata]